jgi:hypothetical protein
MLICRDDDGRSGDPAAQSWTIGARAPFVRPEPTFLAKLSCKDELGHHARAALNNTARVMMTFLLAGRDHARFRSITIQA